MIGRTLNIKHMNLRFLLIGSIALITSFATVAQDELDWKLDLEEAKLAAEESNKFILMSFQGSDWCGNCKRLEKALFQDSAFSDFAKTNLVLLKLDFPVQKKNKLSKEQTAHNEALAEIFNSNGEFPKVLILSADGEKIGEMQHPLTTSDAYIESIMAFLK
jgi:thioredoxin-related protein